MHALGWIYSNDLSSHALTFKSRMRVCIRYSSLGTIHFLPKGFPCCLIAYQTSRCSCASFHISPFLYLIESKPIMPDSGGLEHRKPRGVLVFWRVEAVCRHLSGLAFGMVRIRPNEASTEVSPRLRCDPAPYSSRHQHNLSQVLPD